MKAKRTRQRGRSYPRQQTFRIDRSVLVVEDQRSQSKMAEAMLREKWGCEVHIATTYKQAQGMLESRAQDFVAAICDLNLPDAPYGEVIDLANQYGVPAIALTGTFGEELRSMVLKKGVVDYVLKEGINSYEYVTQLVGRIYKNRSTKVLVADDALSSRAMLKHMLEAQCLNVLMAKDGKEALRIFDKNPDVRLMLVDYNMPEMDGFNLVLEVRNRLGKDRLAIIGISGEGDEKVSAKFLKNGANDFIAKPYTFEELSCRVTQNLEMLDLVESLRNTANRDFLTGMYNRRYFFSEGYEIYNRAKRRRDYLCAAMIDVDHFKKINDDHGHDIGDFILKSLAKRLNEYFSGDLVARLGGEEFAVLMADGDEEACRGRLEGFRRHIEESPVRFGERDITFTVSTGGNRELHEDLDAMLKAADENLYRAKEEGRNRVIF